MWAASSGSKMSPLAMTGMDTVCFTWRMMSQSARPAYIWVLVRPWMVMAAAPAASMAWAKATALTLPLSQPFRVLTVTGTPASRRTASTIAMALSGSFIRAEPSPLLATLGTGQPVLMSMQSGWARSMTLAAAWAMQSMSLPKSCTAAGCSVSPSSIRRRVFLS